MGSNEMIKNVETEKKESVGKKICKQTAGIIFKTAERAAGMQSRWFAYEEKIPEKLELE